MIPYLRNNTMRNNINSFIYNNVQLILHNPPMTLVKKINIYIPKVENLPSGFADLTPEETILVIKGGYSAYKSSKEDILLLSNDELYSTIRKEIEDNFQAEKRTMQETIEKLEKDMILQQQLFKASSEQQEETSEKIISKRLETYDHLQHAYKEEREYMQNRIISLETQIANINSRTREEAMKLVNQDLENLRHILAEKDKQTENMKTSLDKAVEKIDTITHKKTTVSLGKIGEKQFDDIARTAFRDFDGFEIEDMHSIAGQGDFHLKFRGFTILADSKLYSNKVNSTSRDKIKRDLKKNDHIQFAWLVSLDTTIDKFDKAPFMFEWLSERKCVCYINELMKYDEPSEILRAVWYCCNTLYSIMTTEETLEGGGKELSRLREHELKIKEIAQKMVKNNRERETIVGQLRANFDKNDEYIREILNEEINKMTGDYYGHVIEWWNSKMVEQNGSKLKSNNIWLQFKKDNETLSSKIDCNIFKDILCSFITEKNIIKPRTKTGAIEILNYSWKTQTTQPTESLL